MEVQTANVPAYIERIGNHTKHLILTSRQIMDTLLQQHSTKKDNHLKDILKPT
jgi:hypothetical protein